MTAFQANTSQYSKTESWKMFNRIAGRYDFLNRLLSFGLDIGWRKRLNAFLPSRENLEILDLASGTGDVLLYLVKANSNIHSAYGIDLAENMLAIGNEKITRLNFQDKITLQKGDANDIPFTENCFDAVTIAFGIRNVEEPEDVLNEMHRVLRKDGQALILEFSRPKNKILRSLHAFYLNAILPFLGAVFSGDFKAYRYLGETVQTFIHGDEFCELMKDAGFQNVKAHPLTFGVATIYEGEK